MGHCALYREGVLTEPILKVGSPELLTSPPLMLAYDKQVPRWGYHEDRTGRLVAHAGASTYGSHLVLQL